MGGTTSVIGTGIDINGLVAQLVAVQRDRPTQLLNARESTLISQISAIGQLKSSMSSFQDSLAKLDSSSFLAYSGSSSNSSVATITADETAREGSFTLVLDSGLGHRLATANKVISSGFADASTTEVGTGDITISNANGGSFTLSFAGGSGDNTLNAIRDSINTADDNFGVTATIVNVDNGGGGTESKLVLTANDTGLNNSLTVTADAGISALDSANLTPITDGLDAIFTIDGQTVTRASNTVNDAISGIDITLLTEGTTTLNVNTDNDAIVANVQSFVDAFNGLQGTLASTSSYNGGNPGPLFSDSTANSVNTIIRDIISGSVASATGVYTSLASIGITTTDTGSLELNSTELKAALNADFNSVSTIFTASDGIASQFTDSLTQYTQFAGLLDSKTDSLNSRKSLIDNARDQLDFRLSKLEERLTAQFVAMDLLVQNLNSTSSFLTQQLANLPGFTRKK